LRRNRADQDAFLTPRSSRIPGHHLVSDMKLSRVQIKFIARVEQKLRDGLRPRLVIGRLGAT